MPETTAIMPEERKAATLEDVWAVIREIGENLKEIGEKHKEIAEKHKENDRWLEEYRQETDRRIQENDRQLEKSKAEHDRMIAETDLAIQKMSAKVDELSDNVGGVNNSLGDMAEGLMASDLYEKFEALGLEFNHSSDGYEKRDKKTKRKLLLADMLLENETIVIVVKVKTTMTRGDVDKHEKRMDILRREPNSLFINRALYGAMAGVKMGDEAREYALEKGFFVIELTGNMVKIDVPAGFTPKTW